LEQNADFSVFQREGRASRAFIFPQTAGERRLAMAIQLNATEARQATKRPRAMIWVLVVSLMLCIIAGLALGVGWTSMPWGS
jgi:predicted Na+-dependent transporter